MSLAALLAQTDPTSLAPTVLDRYGLIGLLLLLCVVGGGYLIKRLLDEIAIGRVAYLGSLEKQHVDHAVEIEKIMVRHEAQTDRVLDRIDGLACAQPEQNGRDRNSRGGSQR